MSAPAGLHILVPSRTTRDQSGELEISYLSPLLAVVTGIVHAGLAPAVEIAGVRPNLVLVAVVLATCLFGLLPGAVWAFAAGLTANLLVGQPLGSIPLALLTVAALVAGGQRIFGRLVWIYPIVAGFAGSVVADAVALGLGQLLPDRAPVGSFPLELVVPAAILNAAILALCLVPARGLAQRWAPDESAAW